MTHTYIPVYILVPWCLKCLTELLLTYVVITRRVRYVWLLAGYSFWTTLGLMLMAETRSPHWQLANKIVSVGGGGMMLLVAVGLVVLLGQGKREYGRIALAYVALCASQVVAAQISSNLWAMYSWLVMILWLAWECHRIPRSRLKAVDVYLLMMRDVLG